MNIKDFTVSVLTTLHSLPFPQYNQISYNPVVTLPHRVIRFHVLFFSPVMDIIREPRNKSVLYFPYHRLWLLLLLQYCASLD